MNRIKAIIVAVAMVFAMLNFAPAALATDGEDCVPVDYAVTGWVTEQPPGEGWVQIDERTVIDKEAYDETVVDAPAIEAQHYSLKGNSGIEKDEVPVFPADYWQANTTHEPHENNPNVTWYSEYGVGLHYTSHGSEGLRDWFYFQPYVPEQTHIVHHEAVTHQEYRFERQAVTCPPDEPNLVEFEVFANAIDGCGVADDRVVHTRTDRVVWTKPVDTDKRVVLVASDVSGDRFELVGKTRWDFTFFNRPCDTDKPDKPSEPKKNEPGPPAQVNSPDVPTAVAAGLTGAPEATVDQQTNPLAAVGVMLGGLVLFGTGLFLVLRRYKPFK